jgi:hypothetical protein
MSSSQNLTPGLRHWPDLDYLRGIAALLMTVNHLAALLLGEQDQSRGHTGTLFFIGSFAPVLFYFVTGVGQGLQPHRSAKQSCSAPLYRAALLCGADLMLTWHNGHAWGLDFLGFIALSGLALELLSRCSRPLLTATVCLALILALRILAAPLARRFGLEHSLTGALLFGTAAIEGVSYLIVPWLCFPLAGYLFGTLYRARSADFATHRPIVIALLIFVVAAGASTWFILHGAPVFRWGTMSVAYLGLSFALLALCVPLTHILARNESLRPLANALSLNGTTAFFLVPVHYCLIDLLASVPQSAPPLAPMWFVPLAILVCPLVFMTARYVDATAHRLGHSLPLPVLLGTAAAAASLIVLLRSTHPTPATLSLTLGQIALGFAFVRSKRRKRSADQPRNLEP